MKEYKIERDFQDRFNPQRVIYAGTSSRRTAFLGACFPHLTLETVYPGKEPETEDVGFIANFKLLKGLEQRSLQDGEIMVASDTRTRIPIVSKDNSVNLISKGKPESLDQVYKHFSHLDQMIKIGENPCYRVDSATAVAIQNGKLTFREITDNCFIKLKSDVSYLATDNGFLEYLLAFDEFYESRPYQDNRMQGIQPTDFSSGFSLPVFVKLGLVDSINGIEPNSPLFKKILMQAIHTVGIGFSFSVMEEFGINLDELSKRWDWLEGVTKNAL